MRAQFLLWLSTNTTGDNVKSGHDATYHNVAQVAVLHCGAGSLNKYPALS